MTTKGDTVILKDFDPRRYKPHKRGIDIAWKPIDRKNKEWYATLFGSTKDNITMDDINSELVKLSRNLLSDRARTIKNKPKYKVVNGIKEVIN